LPDGRSVTISLCDDDASQVGGALLGMAGAPSQAGSLFQMMPFLTIWNPPLELRRLDRGEIVIALKPRDFRPVILQLETAEAGQLRDLLNAAL